MGTHFDKAQPPSPAQPSFPAQPAPVRLCPPAQPAPVRPCPSLLLLLGSSLSASPSHLLPSSLARRLILIFSRLILALTPSVALVSSSLALTPSASPLPARGSPSPSVPLSLCLSECLSLSPLAASSVLRIVRRRFVALRPERSNSRKYVLLSIHVLTFLLLGLLFLSSQTDFLILLCALRIYKALSLGSRVECRSPGGVRCEQRANGPYFTY